MCIRDRVVWAYKRLLGRPPEVQSIIDDWVAKRCTLDDLIDKITASDEFKINTLGRAIHDAKQRAWLRFNQSFIFKTVAAAFVGCLTVGRRGRSGRSDLLDPRKAGTVGPVSYTHLLRR